MAAPSNQDVSPDVVGVPTEERSLRVCGVSSTDATVGREVSSAALEEKFPFSGHDHKLERTERDAECQVCGERGTTFSCVEGCEYNVCSECFLDDGLVKAKSFFDAIEDPEAPIFDVGLGWASGWSFPTYFCMCLFVCLLISGMSLGLWSHMVCEFRCIDWLQERTNYFRLTSLAIAATIFLTLYVSDYFFPPHLPGRHFVLFDGDQVFGKSCVSVAFFAFLASCYCLAKEYPTVPLIITIFLCPVCILFLRQITMPKDISRGRNVPGVIHALSVEDRMLYLRSLAGAEHDQVNFWRAAVHAHWIAGVLVLCVWIPWAYTNSQTMTDALSSVLVRNSTGIDLSVEILLERDYMTKRELERERERIFVWWFSPLIVGVSNLLFCMLMEIRLALNRSYAATDDFKNRLIVEHATNQDNEIVGYRLDRLQEKLQDEVDAGTLSPEKLMEATQDKVQLYLTQHMANMKKLTKIMKDIGTSLVVMIGFLYVLFQLSVADSNVAHMIQGFVGAFFVTFVGLILVSFNRLWQAMSDWIGHRPEWERARQICTSNWVRGLFLTTALPIVPVVLFLSALNQQIRIWRGLDETPRAEQGDESPTTPRAEQGSANGGDPAPATGFSNATDEPGGKRRQWFTTRVQKQIDDLHAWDWVQIVWFCYVWPPVLILYKIIPTFLNVGLAYLTIAMKNLLQIDKDNEMVGFVLILVATYSTGMFLFMLPPVPGPPIYLFAGIVIPKAAEQALDIGDSGFWVGALMAIILCFFMKLSACAVQQKLIGEKLGDREWVRQLVRVHTPEMRTIESVLRKPGMAFGKVMILCGGPDWPTSVLAGILHIPLTQCLIGTCPVISSVIPLVLSGTFIIKRVDGAVWARAGTLMFSLTAVVSLVFIGGTAWAIQDEYERHHEKFTQPREEYVNLDWMDHKAAKIKERCVVKWPELPRFVRVAFVTGACLLIICSEIFFFAKQACIGIFVLGSEEDNKRQLDALNLVGEDALIMPMGAATLATTCLAFSGLFVYKSWRKGVVAPRVAAAIAELNNEEQEWKGGRIEEAREAAGMSPETRQLQRLATFQSIVGKIARKSVRRATRSRIESRITFRDPMLKTFSDPKSTRGATSECSSAIGSTRSAPAYSMCAFEPNEDFGPEPASRSRPSEDLGPEPASRSRPSQAKRVSWQSDDSQSMQPPSDADAPISRQASGLDGPFAVSI